MSNVTSILEARKPRSWGRMRWDWAAQAAADDRLSSPAKLLCYVLIAQFAHHESGECRPGLATLGERIGAEKRTVQRALQDLENEGWIARSGGGGRGDKLSISFLFPGLNKGVKTDTHNDEKGVKTDTLSDEKRVSVLARKGVKNDAPPRPPYKDKPNFNQRAQPQKPRLPFARTVAADGGEIERWNAWLSGRGLPRISDLGPAVRAVTGQGFEVPQPYPPSSGYEVGIAEKWVEWALSAGEIAEAGGT